MSTIGKALVNMKNNVKILSKLIKKKYLRKSLEIRGRQHKATRRVSSKYRERCSFGRVAEEEAH